MPIPDAHFHRLSSLVWARDEDFLTGSQAILHKSAAPTVAIVFVHGFGGSAIGTWEQFPNEARDASLCNADWFFLQYPSTTESVANCGRELKEFLGDLLRHPASTISNLTLPANSAPRATEWRYSRLLLVGHSMGAVVVRRAVLNLDRDGLDPWEEDAIRLLFFAPAHLGSHLPSLVTSGLGLDFLPGASLVGQALVTYFSSLRDLQQGSGALAQLLGDSQQARNRRLAGNRPDANLRALVIHARGDKVVVPDRFDEDDDRRPAAGEDHRSVCKPSGTYRRPVDALGARL